MKTRQQNSLVHGASSDAGTQAAQWLASGRELGFVYLRQGGGLIQTGRARLETMDDATLKLTAPTCSLLVVHLGAVLTPGPQWFFESHLQGAYQVDGLAFALANGDWLFLSEGLLPDSTAQHAFKPLD